ncbi:hypothetical protein [Paenibacillus sp. GP183]|uniref:hypothetical protein n=1 Tax=Paenibacillus sp. GP183 TaxID=1882751 RepID=UPI000B851576|nr:hypothetical protein [Paenibacillus sp. GP183]
MSEEDPDRLVKLWREERKFLDTLVKGYDAAKEEMMRSRLLKKERKLSCNFGSVSLLEGKPSYDVESIYRELGDQFLVKYGKVDMLQLDEYMAMGFLKKKELDQFRKIVDVRLKFVLIEQEAEAKLYDFFQRNLQRLSRISRVG